VRRTRPRKAAKAKERAPAKETTKHLSAGALYDFLQVITPESADFEIAAHLVNCPKCARVARQLAQAQAVVEDWSAESRRRARALRSRRKTDSSR
jgi:hypothetical protein